MSGLKPLSPKRLKHFGVWPMPALDQILSSPKMYIFTLEFNHIRIQYLLVNFYKYIQKSIINLDPIRYKV